MKLISMTDFIYEIGNSTLHESYERDLAKFYNYCTFLKQPLEKWMFVPCDKDGNALVEPDINSPKYDINISEFETHVDFYMYDVDLAEYQQAKETCIFKNNLLSLIEIKELISKSKTIEFLINYHYEKTGSYLEAYKELF